MNKALLMGRLTADPEIRYSQNQNATCVARYTLAVDRRFKRDGEQQADFIRCVAFGKAGEFAEKYLRKGTKISIVGRITTGSYTNKDGQKVYTTEITIEEQEFAESKSASQRQGDDQQQSADYGVQNTPQPQPDEGFAPIPDDDGDLPF